LRKAEPAEDDDMTADTLADRSDVRAVRVHRRGDLRIEPVSPPVAADDQAVVRVRYGGICGSDVHYWRDGAVGSSILRGPMILGHEIVGTVARPAHDGSGPGAGRPVAIHPAEVCGTCRWCRAGEPNLCVGCRYLGSAAQRPHTDGGFVEEIAVPTRRLLDVPDGLDLRRAGLAEPAAVAWHAVDRVATIGGRVQGSDALVVGGGPIGLLIMAVAAHRGAASTTVVDVHERPLETARRIGATRVLRATELPGGGDESLGADITFESSGAVAGLASALRQTRRGGAVVMVGQLPAGDLAAPLGLVVSSELRVTGSLRIDGELPQVLEFLAQAGDTLDPLITDVVPLDDALSAFELAADPSRSTKVLLDFGAR
jgi:L-idonate 5-dehydrogenase